METTDAPLTWFITGTSRGLGWALAATALRSGHRVAATVRKDPEGVRDALLQEAATPDSAERLLVLPLDIRDRDEGRAAVEVATQRFGSVDVLVNNAGYGLVGAVEEVSESEARDMVDTGLLGALWLTQAVLPGMRAQGGGQIVQISSTGGVGTMPTMGLYGVAKWGLEAFSEALSAEVKGLGIRVTIVEPGSLDTEWATGSMRFTTPDPAYDEVRTNLFGTAEVPWPVEPGATGGGTSPEDAAAAILVHVLTPGDDRLRLLVGDDAPGQVATVLAGRRRDYGLDARFRDAPEPDA